MTATLETKIDALAEDVAEIRTALLGSTAPGSPPGLIRRTDDNERETANLRIQLADLKTQLADLTASVRAIEATPGKTAITWWDRVGLGLLGLLLSAIGAVIGAALKAH